jgi:PPM family protein phosphatase
MTDPSNSASTAAATAAAATSGPIKLKVFGRTDVGQVREHNEDNFLISDLTTKSRGLREEDRQRTVDRSGNLFAVCDGMGGAAAGEVASQMAVDLIYDLMTTVPTPRSRDDLARNLVRAVEEAGLRIYNEARADRTRRGMGTTATVAALIDARLFLAQVGDSRGYLLRGEQLVQVTRDQSLVNQLIEAGQLTEEEAETFEHNNIILQALGTSETVQVDLTYVDLRAGDTLLLCSDGLSGMIRDSELRDVLLTLREPMEACRELTSRANAAGGHDNITVLVIQFNGEGLRAPASEDAPLVFRRYSIPNEALSATGREGRTSSADLNAPPSEEAKNETRDLRVSHTMVGTTVPMPVVNPADADPAQRAAMHSAATHSAGAAATDPPPPNQTMPTPRVYSEGPIELPTHGLAPRWVGAIVVLSLVVVALVGLFLLR